VWPPDPQQLRFVQLVNPLHEPFLLFNQQQCFIYLTASFLSKLRAKKVEKLRN
jgi:hypothetical protein